MQSFLPQNPPSTWDWSAQASLNFIVFLNSSSLIVWGIGMLLFKKPLSDLRAESAERLQILALQMISCLFLQMETKCFREICLQRYHLYWGSSVWSSDLWNPETEFFLGPRIQKFPFLSLAPEASIIIQGEGCLLRSSRNTQGQWI